MICPRCKTENKEEAKYCRRCGAKLPAYEEEDYYEEWEEEDDGSLLTKILITVGVVVFLLVFTVLLFLIVRNHNKKPDVEFKEITTEEAGDSDDDTDQSTQDTTDTDDSTTDSDQTSEEESQEDTPISIANQYRDKATREPVEYGGHAYALFDYKKNNLPKDFFACEEFCESMGGHMAVISSEEENEFLYNFVQNNGESYAFFGFTDEGSEGKWRWVDGSPVVYKNWCIAEDQPNNRNGEEHYAQFYGKMKDGSWCDAKFGSGSWKFICEWE